MALTLKTLPIILKLLDLENLILNRFRRNLLGLRKMKKVMALTVKILKVLFNRIKNLKERKRMGKILKILITGEEIGEEGKLRMRKVKVMALTVKILLL